MTVILTPTAEHKVTTRNGLWMSAADAEKVTGWTLKPEGMCRDERCVPLPAAAVKAARISRPSSVRIGMFCKFGLMDERRPVDVAAD